MTAAVLRPKLTLADGFLVLRGGQVALIDPADAALVAPFSWHLTPNGYVQGRRTFDGALTRILLHRLILGARRGQEVDHRSGNKLDCRRCNLRFCEHRENMRNKAAHRGSSSRFKGVTWSKAERRWKAYLRDAAGHQLHLGYFGDEVAAAHAHDVAARLHHGAFARLNFPEVGG